MSNSLLVGIDVSLNDNKVRILHPDGTSLSKFVVSNSVPGAKTLSQKVTGIAEQNSFDSIVIGLESTSIYGDPLVYFLKQDDSVNRFNTKIHVLNPTQVNKFKEKIFSDRFGATSSSIIEDFFSVDEISYMPIEELVEFINKKGKGHFENPDEIAAAVQKAARSSYRLPKTVTDSVNQILAVSFAAMKAYKEQLKIFDKAIEEQFKLIPNTLSSVKGIGPVYAAGIVAEIGDVHRFKDHAALAKFEGIAWTKHQSGNFTAAHTHLIKFGNRYLRYYIMEATNKVRMHDHELKRFYDLKYSQTPKTPHKRALALTARKFVRLVYALLHSNRLYTPPKGE